MQTLGIDIGGSGIKGAIVDTKSGELASERHRIKTPQPATPPAVAEVIAELVKHFDWRGPIGCTFPAIVRNGVTLTAANVDKSWIGADAAGIFREATGCLVCVLNDADAAGVAEMTHGAGKDYHRGKVMVLTFGTGIGSAIFHDGKLFPNSEFGHMPMPMKGIIAEHYCSDRTRKQEDLSWQVWAKRTSNYLEVLELLLSPDLFILGGGISKKSEKYLPELQIHTEIVPAQLLNNAGIVGAAMAACDLSR